jgi:hypothetical protein
LFSGLFINFFVTLDRGYKDLTIKRAKMSVQLVNNMKKLRKLTLAVAAGTVLLAGASAAMANGASTAGINPKALQMGMKAYQWAQAHGKVNKPYLTIVDLSMPSKERRLWVIDVKNNQVLANELVANAKNSGVDRAVRFSNAPSSKESSLGVYETAGTYIGKHGNSLRVIGLENGINNNAYRRAIVVHPAAYVSRAFAAAHGRVGNSWGCFALSPRVAPKVINLIKGGSVIFAYAPQENNDRNLRKV